MGTRQQPGGIDLTRTTRLADDGCHYQHSGAVVHYPASIVEVGHRLAGQGSIKQCTEKPSPTPGPLVYGRHRSRCRGAAVQSCRHQSCRAISAVMVVGTGRRPLVEPPAQA